MVFSGLVRMTVALLLTGAAPCVVAAPTTALEGFEVRDPHFGSVLFHFYQQDHFAALAQLETFRYQQKVSQHEDLAELLQGGLLLSWGQHEDATVIFERLLDTTGDQAVRDRALFYLGKVRYQRGHRAAAENALIGVSSSLPPELEAERLHLLSRLYMDRQDYAAAISLLAGWRGDPEWAAYARYNLGVALVRSGRVDEGVVWLQQVGQLRTRTEELRNLRDKANLALGFARLQNGEAMAAQAAFQQVRLNGAFSNQALLGAGWAASVENLYEQALVNWIELGDRDLLDPAVQESLLAVPFAFARIGVTAQAAAAYSHALHSYDTELERLDVALVAAGNGELLKALLEADGESMGTWYWELEGLPVNDASRYLYFTIADHDFHEGLKSYRDLRALAGHLEGWRQALEAFRDMVSTRERAYAERLPRLDARLAQVDVPAMRAEQATLVDAFTAAQAQRDVVALAPVAEQALWQRLEALESGPAWASPDSAALRERQRVLKGVLLWSMEREFRLRSWQQSRELDALDRELDGLEMQLKAIGLARDSLDASVAGFAARIDRAEAAIAGLQSQVDHTMGRYSAHLNGMAVAQLQAQRERMSSYRAQARYALATLYDRMAADASGAGR